MIYNYISQYSDQTSKLARPFYRVRQFGRGFSARVTVGEMQQVDAILPAAAATLFRQMPLDAQRHSLNVLQTLQTAGRNQPALAAAALLHDVGKIAAVEAHIRFGLWLRGPLVLIEAIAPQWLRRLARADPRAGWRYVLHVHIEHPRIGAQLARQSQCSPLTCWLIEHHQAPVETAFSPQQRQLLAALQWADNRN